LLLLSLPQEHPIAVAASKWINKKGNVNLLSIFKFKNNEAIILAGGGGRRQRWIAAEILVTLRPFD
jgi:hypothetical protein